MNPTRIQIGLLGLGRLGKIYARDLATRIPETRLVAVGDVRGELAREVARTYQVSKAYSQPLELIHDPQVEAVVVVTPTHTHCSLVAACLEAGKPVFCEKPLSISLPEALALKEAIQQSGVFFQMGFMRRFDRGFSAAHRKIQEGSIGTPVLFKSTSRDPYPPPLEYADPRSSGGLIIDMGIHDFDLARWFMGEVETVSAVGGILAYPELGTVGDIDNAVVTLCFRNGKLGVVDLSRNGVYGYDIWAEILGTEGSVRVGYLRETPILLLHRNRVCHDTVPFFMERFEDAYRLQLQNFATNLLRQRPAPITVEDGIEALRIAQAATQAQKSGQPVRLPELPSEGS